jgi:hypothetical protein
MAESFKPLATALGPLFADLERRTQATLDLAARVRNALPEPVKDHVVSATYRGETLVVLTDSAAWCPYVRYAHAALKEALRGTHETQFTKLKVKVGRGESS